jgi:4-amino-4-deoxy-L-arabinose transferase-like glycosyltransferase
MMLKRRDRTLLGLAAVCFTVLWFALLGGRALFDPDEGRYAEIPREMLSGGDWLTPHLNGLVYLEKPPLQYWLTALSLRGFGESEAAARLWTGLAGYLSLAVVFALGRRLWGFEAGVKALLLTSASTLFVLLGHQLTLDMTLSFFLLACLGAFLMAQLERDDVRRGRAWMLGCWAAMALATLSKGLIGTLIPAATLLLYCAWAGDRTALRRLHLRLGTPLYAAIAAPWFVLVARANPDFLSFFFLREHLQRFLTPIEERTEPWWFFGAVLAVGILPWLPLALRSLLKIPGPSVPRGEFDARRVLWIWCVFVLVFFSLSHSKLIPYILPMVAPLALLCTSPAPSGDRASLGAAAALSLAAGLGVFGYTNGLWSSAHGPDLGLLLHTQLAWIAAVLCAAASACAWLAWRARTQWALASLCAGWFIAAACVLLAASSVEQLFSAKQIALALAKQAPAGAPVYSVGSYQQSLPFYLKHSVVLVDYRDEFALGLAQQPDAGIATLAEFSRRWQLAGEGYAVMPRFLYERLSAQGTPMRAIGQFPRELMLVSRR